MRQRGGRAKKPTSGGAGAPPAPGPLADYLGYALRRAQTASFRHLERSAGAALTPGQFSQLLAIEANPGINQRRLAAMFGLDKSTLSPAMEVLVARNLVQRARAAKDARAWSLTLTPAGRQALVRMRAKVEAQERLMAAALAPQERARLLDALRRIEAALDAAE